MWGFLNPCRNNAPRTTLFAPPTFVPSSAGFAPDGSHVATGGIGASGIYGKTGSKDFGEM